ncbi:MAG TPA: hypothetical protein VGS08_00395 [Candidatus Saccharimonadales bacterium]|nr:hypothetical protein [Candidatus Saccharimonadales bacterium]
MPTKLHTFTLDGKNHEVTFVETIYVKEGVECDTYAFVGDATQDLAIIHVTKGCKTPLQRVLYGKTAEGFLEGKGILTVRSEDGHVETYTFDSKSANKEVVVQAGQIIQWIAPEDAGLVFYEICDPPYQDGRYENLPEEDAV